MKRREFGRCCVAAFSAPHFLELSGRVARPQPSVIAYIRIGTAHFPSGKPYQTAWWYGYDNAGKELGLFDRDWFHYHDRNRKLDMAVDKDGRFLGPIEWNTGNEPRPSRYLEWLVQDICK